MVTSVIVFATVLKAFTASCIGLGTLDMSDRQRLYPKKSRKSILLFPYTQIFFLFILLFSFGKTLYLPYLCAAKMCENYQKVR